MELPDSNCHSDDSVAAIGMPALRRALLARLKQAAPVLLVLAAIGSAAMYGVFEPRYRSHADLMISDLPPGFVDRQIDLLRGTGMIRQAYESDRLAMLPELRDLSEEDAVRWIFRRLRVERLDSEFCEISFSTRHHPESARKIVDAVVMAYLNYNHNEEMRPIHQMADRLRAELADCDSDIEVKRQTLYTMLDQADDDIGRIARISGGDRSLELELAEDELEKAAVVRGEIADRLLSLTIEHHSRPQVLLYKEAKIPEFRETPRFAALLPVAGVALGAACILLLVCCIEHLSRRARA
jgi:hypothetical protein